MAELRQVGLVTGDGVRPLRVAAPATVRRLLDAAERELEDRRHRLAEAHQVVERLESDYVRARAEMFGAPRIDAVDPAAATTTVRTLVQAGQGQLAVMHHGPGERGAGDRALFEALAAAVDTGRRLRGVYPAGLLDDPRWEAWARRRAAIGEEQRLSTRPVPAVIVVEGEGVVIGHGDPGGPVLLSRAPHLVEVFTVVFEGWWQAGAPLPGGDGDEARTRLLGLLAAGCKDESVARTLGWSVRTVRRRVADLMQEVGAETRMQLGVEAVRRGLL
jgi:hypothetical protein